MSLLSGLGRNRGQQQPQRRQRQQLRQSIIRQADAAAMPDAGEPSVAQSAEESSPALADGSASMASSVFNLAKAIMGAGSIALPGSVVSIGDVKSAVWPVSIILFVMGGMSAYSFSIIGSEV